MPAALTRNEYYWEDDRLVCRANRRKSVHARWRLPGRKDDLVVAFEDRGNAKKVTPGRASTPSRIAHAILREERLSADPNAKDIGPSIPRELLSKASNVAKSAVDAVTRQFRRLPNEERKTGLISGDLNRFGVIEHEGWELTIILQGFSSQTKEPIAGADVGVIVDVKNGGQQVSKGLWVQAKQAETTVDEPLQLAGLKKQMGDMLDRTHEAYGLVYTPDGVFAFQGFDSQSRISLEDLISDTVACKRGDRRPELLADTVHEDFLIEMAFRNLAVPPPGQQWLFK
jgi:hypothetical protein